MQSSGFILNRLSLANPPLLNSVSTDTESAYDNAIKQIEVLLKIPANNDPDDIHDFTSDLAQLNRTLELIESDEDDSSDSDEGTSQQGMTHKPKDGFLDIDNKIKRLLKDLELLVSRLQKIKHTLENGVEHDPSILKDLAMQARRLSRNLHSLERKFKHNAPTQDEGLRKQIREQLANAYQVKRDIDKAIAPVYETPRPTF